MKLVSYFSELRLIYYDFLKLIIISGINKRFSEKEKHTTRHVAASRRATCHADVSTRSANADIIMTSVLTWSTLTKSMVNEVHIHVGSTSQRHCVPEQWVARVSSG